MREIKVRWFGADGSSHTRRIEIPDSAKIYMGVDKFGREVWTDDIVEDDFGNRIRAGYLTMPLDKMSKVI